MVLGLSKLMFCLIRYSKLNPFKLDGFFSFDEGVDCITSNCFDSIMLFDVSIDNF